MKLFVAAPMSREARAIGEPATAVGAGLNFVFGLRRAIDDESYAALMVAGVCGGLDPALRAGDVIVVREAIHQSRPPINADEDLLALARSADASRQVSTPDHRQRRIEAPVLSVEAPVIGRRDRLALWSRSGCAGIDMETYQLAEVAKERGIPWVGVRVVLDAVSMRLPSALGRWRDESDDTAVAWSILRQPRDWPAGVRLARDMRRALASLSSATAAIATAIEAAR